MPPKGSKKLPMTPAQAEAAGLSARPITSFFSAPSAPRPDAQIPLKKRGRPAKSHRGRPSGGGRPSGASSADPQNAEAPVRQIEVYAATLEVEGGEGASRMERASQHTDWSAPEKLAELRVIVDDWFEKTGEWLSLTPTMSFTLYCRCVGISKSTLHGYVHPVLAKRTPLGSHKGAPGLVKKEVQNFVVDVLRRRDRANEGLTNRDTAEMIHDLVPELNIDQVTGALRKTVRPNNKDLLTNIVKAQASTTKRSQITVAQQFRWHTVRSKCVRVWWRAMTFSCVWWRAMTFSCVWGAADPDVRCGCLCRRL